MEKKSKIICKNNLKNSDNTMLTIELTEKIAKLICRMEQSSYMLRKK